MTERLSNWRRAARYQRASILACPKCGEVQPFKGKPSIEYDVESNVAVCSVCAHTWAPHESLDAA